MDSLATATPTLTLVVTSVAVLLSCPSIQKEQSITGGVSVAKRSDMMTRINGQ